jgi:hypothetical protein
MRRVATVMSMGFALMLEAVPALAGIPARIPEPATMGMFAAGAIGIYVARRLAGPK